MNPRCGLAVLALLTVLTPARALEGPPIRDGAGLYSKKAIDRATVVINKIREQFHFDVCIETMRQLPEKDRLPLKGLKKKHEIEEYLRKVAQSKADDLRINGLYVLLTMDPLNVAVVGWPEPRELDDHISTEKRRQLLRRLQRERGSTDDQALVRALENYRASLREPAPPPPLPPVVALIVVGVLLAVWAVLWLVRRHVAARRSGGEAPPPLYLPAVQASLFGVPAGFWVTDRLFKLEQQAVPVPPPEPDEPLLLDEAAPPEGTPP